MGVCVLVLCPRVQLLSCDLISFLSCRHMCSCCAWFKSFAVHPIEKASLPEFFDGSINDKHGADVSNFHALSNIGSSHVSNIERKKLYYCSVLAAEASDTRIKAESDNYCL